MSVVIPTHDRARLLLCTLQTALAQEDVNLEVIVVDDASQDDTPSQLAALEDPRLRVLRLERNQGQSAARNAGVETARGSWVAFLDDDDLWAPTKLRRQLDAARACDATWVYCGALLISPQGDVVRMWGPPEPGTVLRQLLERNVVQAGASTVLAQTARVRAVGGFDESLGALADRDLWIRLAADGPAAAVAEPLAAYRRHANTVITSGRITALAEADRVAERYRALAAEHGVTFDRSHFERWLESEFVRSLRTRATLLLEERRRLEAFRTQLRAFGRSRSSADARRLLSILAGDRLRERFRRTRPVTSGSDESREPVPDWLAPYLPARTP